MMMMMMIGVYRENTRTNMTITSIKSTGRADMRDITSVRSIGNENVAGAELDMNPNPVEYHVVFLGTTLSRDVTIIHPHTIGNNSHILYIIINNMSFIITIF